MTLWATTALVLQVVGLILTAVGLRITWAEFHDPDERFVDEFLRALRRLDPRRRRDRVVHTELAEGIGTADDASGVVTFGPLPDDEREAIALLGQRVQGLRSNLESTATGLRRDVNAVTRRVDVLVGDVATETEQRKTADRRVATDGLRLEALGLVIVALGVLASLVDGLTR